MKKLLLLLIALLGLGVSGVWAQVTSITDGDMYTIRLNKATTYFFGYHYKTTNDAAPFKFVYAGESEGDYKLYYLQCPFTGLYLHSTRTTKDGSDISLEWVSSTSSATLYTIRPTASGATTFRIFPKESTYSLTAWNSNAANYNIIPWDNNSDLGLWNLISANNVNEYEFQVNDLTGDFSRTGGGTSDWKDKWDAKASLFSLQITTTTNNSSYRYDMKYASSSLQIASSSDKTAYYTMTAPDGCVISGYRVSGTTNGAITLVKGDGTSIDYASGATLTNVGESGIARKVTKFTLKGENKVITGSLYIKVRKLKTITSVSEIDRNKCYAIDTKDRGNWSVRNNYSYLTRNEATGLNIASDFSDAKQQFAFVYYDGTDNETDDGAYYLYSVSAQKFITASGTDDNSVVTLDTKGTQSISFLSSGITNYPVCIEMSNTADMNVRNDSWEAGVTVYGTSGSHKDDDGNAVRIYEIDDFDPTAAEDTWNTTDVTYSLYYNGTKIGDDVVVADVTAGTPAVIPSSMDNGFMTYTYTPTNISSLSPSVRIDATWNGPFQYASSYNASTAKWYTIAHNYSERANNYIWKYNGTDNVMPETVATDNYAGVTNNHLFCFVGDPYSGFTIYNKAAGSSLKVYSSGQSAQVTMNATATTFMATSTRDYSIADGYFSLQPSGSSYYLNWNKTKLAGWTEADNGGTCWVIPEGKYYLTYLNSLVLDAPIGAVGTKAGITDESVRSDLAETKTALESNIFYLDTDKSIVEKITFKTKLNGVKNSETITLGSGYYQILSANSAFVEQTGTRRRVMYNGTKLIWTNDMDTKNVHGIFKLTNTGTDKYSIYSPNGQNYLSNLGGVLGSATDVTITEASSGTAQYSLYMAEGYNGGYHYLHADGHSGGTGTTGNLTAWSAGTNNASAWYIVKVEDVDITLNSDGAGTPTYYATLCLPFDVTISDANAYTLAESGGWLIPTAVENNEVPAGTPVLLKGSKASAKATINTGDAFNSGSPLSCALTGVYVATTIDGSTDYVLGISDGVVGFYHWSSNSLAANRAYVDTPSNVKGFIINWGDEDGIQAVDNGQLTMDNAVIFNLAGQRLNKLQKGVNIVNGKKVLVK